MYTSGPQIVTDTFSEEPLWSADESHTPKCYAEGAFIRTCERTQRSKRQASDMLRVKSCR